MNDANKELDWCKGIEIRDTVGNGFCIRIDGTDIFDDINRYGVKTRRTLQIAKGFKSDIAAKEKAIEWLQDQIEKLRNME